MVEENGFVVVSYNVFECLFVVCMSCSVIVVVFGLKLVFRFIFIWEEGGICSWVVFCSVIVVCFGFEYIVLCRFCGCF